MHMNYYKTKRNALNRNAWFCHESIICLYNSTCALYGHLSAYIDGLINCISILRYVCFNYSNYNYNYSIILSGNAIISWKHIMKYFVKGHVNNIDCHSFQLLWWCLHCLAVTKIWKATFWTVEESTSTTWNA